MNPTPTPSRVEKLEAIQRKCVAANPDGRWRECECDRCSICTSKYNRRRPGLADVLLAYQCNVGWLEPDGMGTLWFCDQVKRWGKPMRDERMAGWRLERADDIFFQDDALIDFLFTLLS